MVAVAIAFIFCAVLAVKIQAATKISGKEISSYVHLIGRFTEDADGNKMSQWPGTGFRFNSISSSSRVTVSLQTVGCTGNCKYFLSVSVDCVEQSVVEFNSSRSFYSFQFDSSPGQQHHVSMVKRTECFCVDSLGSLALGDISVDGADIDASTKEVTPLACPSTRKMMVFGDSISAAYGVEGTPPCTFTAATQNILASYASITAQRVNAELHSIAWSGKGVVRNYGDVNQMSPDPLPIYYNRSIGTDPQSLWDSKSFIPDLVLVMLGSNDYSTSPNPSDDQFISGLTNFIRLIQSDYPSATVLALCAARHSGNQCINIEKSAALTSVPYLQLDFSLYDGGYGCDSHPSVTTQLNIADAVTPVVKKIMGW